MMLRRWPNRMRGLHVLLTVLQLLLQGQAGIAHQHRRDSSHYVRGIHHLSAVRQSAPADHPIATAAGGPAGAPSPNSVATTTAHADLPASRPLSSTAIHVVGTSRRLSGASQAGLAPVTQSVQLPLGYGTGTAVPATAVGCPPPHADLSSAGCPCTVYHDRKGSNSNSARTSPIRSNLCPAGYRCSPSAAAALAAAGWQRNSSNSSKSVPFDNLVTTQDGICISCMLGKFETPDSLTLIPHKRA